MDVASLKTLVQNALVKVLRDDLPSFGNAIGERPIVFRIAHYMSAELGCGGPLVVDCDYNRHGDDIKMLLPDKIETIAFPDGASITQARFFPDIVVHKRREDSSNALACEVKRANDPRGSENDHWRLQALTIIDGRYRYKLGAFIEVYQAGGRIEVEYFENGSSAGKWSIGGDGSCPLDHCNDL